MTDWPTEHCKWQSTWVNYRMFNRVRKLDILRLVPVSAQVSHGTRVISSKYLHGPPSHLIMLMDFIQPFIFQNQTSALHSERFMHHIEANKGKSFSDDLCCRNQLDVMLQW